MPSDNAAIHYLSPFQHIRERLDYSYHRQPHPARAAMQDKLVQRRLSQPFTTSPTPLLLLTAGAMGAGKSHYLSTLPFRYILIDPDEIAASLPPYTPQDDHFEGVIPCEVCPVPDAGSVPAASEATAAAAAALRVTDAEGRVWRRLDARTRHRHEARLITEILLQACMERRADVVLDGSLRSYTWYLAEIPSLRARHHDYRVELVHIHCPLQQVLSRAQRRSTKTGRVVPPSLIERSWRDARRAISVLGRKKLVDRVQMVDSSGDRPKIVYDSRRDPDWVERGVPNDVSRVDRLPQDVADVVENGDDIPRSGVPRIKAAL